MKKYINVSYTHKQQIDLNKPEIETLYEFDSENFPGKREFFRAIRTKKRELRKNGVRAYISQRCTKSWTIINGSKELFLPSHHRSNIN